MVLDLQHCQMNCILCNQYYELYYPAGTLFLVLLMAASYGHVHAPMCDRVFTSSSSDLCLSTTHTYTVAITIFVRCSTRTGV